MRRAMICVSVMLAVLQLWPMVFGKNATASTAAMASPAQVIVSSAPITPRPAVLTREVKLANNFAQAPEKTPVINCYKSYQIAFEACSPADGQCRVKAADHWDLCDARGFWSE